MKFNFIGMKSDFAAVMFASVLAVCVSASCNKTGISGEISGAGNKEVVVNILNINKLQPVDTIKTSEDGTFACKLDVQKGNPEFYYLTMGGRKVAAALVEKGKVVNVKADTLGNFELNGSPEAELYSKVEADYREFNSKMQALAAQMDEEGADFQSISSELTRLYVSYYRDRVGFVMKNSHSLAVVPVLYQKAGDLPVFSQATDAIHFRSLSDSLETVYPDSRYVKALRSEAEKRMNELNLVSRLNAAEPVGFPDIELPDIRAEKKKLSEVDSKLVMLHFWSNSVPEQRQFNLEVLKPVYQRYCSSGLEIYQVALDPDKSAWASTVKAQNLPWINVCDINGPSSKYTGLYMLDSVPKTFFIKDGELVDAKIETVQQLVSTIESLLK